MSDPESAEDQRRILHISEKEARAKLVEVFEVSGCARPLLAVDLDDVLCQTTKCVAECASLFTSLLFRLSLWAPDLQSRAGHNRRFGTDLQIEHFYCQSLYFRIAAITPKLTVSAGRLDLV